LNALAQGNTAFDPGSAVLKEGGKKELDQLAATIAKRKMNVGSVIIAGHTDRFEAESANANLSEERAKAVAAYLQSKGLDQKTMFWEGKGAKDPVPVTKFCE
jgi:OOP family OmpA-OmpF porin